MGSLREQPDAVSRTVKGGVVKENEEIGFQRYSSEYSCWRNNEDVRSPD